MFAAGLRSASPSGYGPALFAIRRPPSWRSDPRERVVAARDAAPPALQPPGRGRRQPYICQRDSIGAGRRPDGIGWLVNTNCGHRSGLSGTTLLKIFHSCGEADSSSVTVGLDPIEEIVGCGTRCEAAEFSP